MSDTAYETERLRLTTWDDAAWAGFFEGTNTPEVMEWLGGVMDADGMVAQRARAETCLADNGFCFWAVERKADGAILGFCGLKRVNAEGAHNPGDMEIGWRFASFAQGQGYAREAATCAMQAAFEDFNAPHVVAITIIENEPSWRLMQKLGMERRTDLDFTDPRYDAPLANAILYAITAEDWADARPSKQKKATLPA